jgi:hypothetical protein
MQHEGSQFVAMRGRIGFLAQLRLGDGAFYELSDDTPLENPDSSRRPSAYTGHSATAANTLALPSESRPKADPSRVSPLSHSRQDQEPADAA